MSSYEKYKAPSIGCILHHLYIYNSGFNNIHVDEVTIGDGKVHLWGKLLATFTWEKNVPLFQFYGESATRLELGQYFMRPIAYCHDMQYNFKYLVQEVTKELTLWEAKCILHCRDNNIKLEEMQGSIAIDIRNTITTEMLELDLHKYVDDYWKHVALCAVYGLTITKEM